MVSYYKYFYLCYRCCRFFWNNVLLYRSGTRTKCWISWIWSQCHWAHDHSSSCGEIYCDWILSPEMHKCCECLENHHIVHASIAKYAHSYFIATVYLSELLVNIIIIWWFAQKPLLAGF